MNLGSISIEDGKEYLAYYILCGSILGVARQYFSLLVIGEGVWILPFFSVSYSLVDGLSFLLKFLLMMVGAIALNIHRNLMVNQPWQHKFKKTFLYLITCGIVTYFLGLTQSPFTFIGVVLFSQFMLVIFKEQEYNPIEFNRLLGVFLVLASTFAAIDVGKIFASDYQSHLRESPAIKKQFEGQEITAIYVNDTYLFIQTRHQNEKKLMIQKTEDVLNSTAKSLTISQ